MSYYVRRALTGRLNNFSGLCMARFTKGGVISALIMGILTVILLPVLIINVTLIIKGSQGGVAPPDVFGIAPLAVTTGSMEGDNKDSFSEGSLIFISILSDEDKQTLEVGQIVTYYDEEADGSLSYTTHRIVEVVKNSAGEITSVVTRGDANNVSDGEKQLSHVVGRCVSSVAGLGAFAMFLQTPAGILVFVGIPVIAFIAYDAIRITLYNRKVREEEQSEKILADKDEEIARLRALVEKTSRGDGPSDGERGEPTDEGPSAKE